MEKKIYITVEEREKCRKVADAFAELEDADVAVVIVDAGRFGFVKLQYYKPPTGFDNDYTFTDSRSLFEDLWKEWLNMFAEEMGIVDVYYDDVFSHLSEEKRKELMDKKRYFAEKAGVEIE